MNLPGVEELVRWNFSNLPEDARIFSEMNDDGVINVTVFYRWTPESEKKRIDLVLEMHLFGHGSSLDAFNQEGYDKFIASRGQTVDVI